MKPIITSLLDIDFYKLTMGQIAWKVPVDVEYTFINRTADVKLAEIIPVLELSKQLHHITTLRFTVEELAYLKKQGIFEDRYLEFLYKTTLPTIDNITINSDGQFDIKVKGKWHKTILWETLILSVINELLYRNILAEAEHDQAILKGRKILTDKIIKIRNSKNPIHFSDFGTRRRFSKAWHEEVIRYLTNADLGASEFLGTSNVYLAKKFNIKPIGTFAHELPMIFAGLQYNNDERLLKSHNEALQTWEQQYNGKLLIALADTYGSDFFFTDFSTMQAVKWHGLRQDSGRPLEFAFKAIDFYKKRNIDPREKIIIFSDSLNLDKIMFLNNNLKGHIKTGFGWGTNLTNDVGCEPVSIVVKATKSNGYDLVKLTDNISKALGTGEAIKRFKRVFNHTNTFNQKTIY